MLETPEPVLEAGEPTGLAATILSLKLSPGFAIALVSLDSFPPKLPACRLQTKASVSLYSRITADSHARKDQPQEKRGGGKKKTKKGFEGQSRRSIMCRNMMIHCIVSAVVQFLFSTQIQKQEGQKLMILME